jgi:glucose-1-phosphate thymidylyltransferase
MKLILPIAGVGARLRPFTFSKPKGFLKIGGLRVVDHILIKIGQNLPQDTPLAVVYGYKRTQIENYLNSKFSQNFKISYIEQTPKGYQGDVPYFGGLGQAILLTRDWYLRKPTIASKPMEKYHLQTNDTLIFLGDMIPVKDYEFVLERMENDSIDGIIGTMVVPLDKTQYYGIVEADQNRLIKSMIEKPKKTQSTLAIAGVYAFKEKTMVHLYEILAAQYKTFIRNEKTTRTEFQFTPSLQQLVNDGFRLEYATFQEGILDFGRPDALLEGNQILLKANHTSMSGAIGEIKDTVIKNPCSIGSDTKIDRSIIGPFVSIGENCVIENCNLNNVVIGDNCLLKDIITSQSIIGDSVKIQGIIKNGIILGDRSFIIESEEK